MKVRILVVEDEAIVRKDLAERIKELGYEVSGLAGSADEALRKAGEDRPDIVLMDIMLGEGKDGIDCAAEMRASMDIPVIYLTAYADDQTLERAKKTEPLGYILKPFEDRDIRSVVEMAMYSHGMKKRLREAQEQLIQSAKMASIGNLASGIAHELRNPLSIILAGIECVSLMKSSDPLFESALSRIRGSVARANKIIVELLKFSRSSRIESVPVDIRQAAGDAISLLEAGARSRGIRITADFAASGCVVNGDISLMRQVFFNLLTNALDACSFGCEVQVKVKESPGEDGAAEVLAEVSDTGAGMDAGMKQKIFDAFFTTKEPGQGTGLGLSITHMIIERHGGKIRVASEPGKGSVFSIALPSFADESVITAGSAATREDRCGAEEKDSVDRR